MIGLPAELTNSNSLCFLNQALAVLAVSGPWSANPNSQIGHLVVDVLKRSVYGGQTEDARNGLARMLFENGSFNWYDDASEYLGQQQSLDECLVRLFEHISGPLVTQRFKYTCTICNAVSESEQSNPAIFAKISPETTVMQLDEMLATEQTEATVHWRCATSNCLGNIERPKPPMEDDKNNFALGGSFVVGALPDTFMVVCKRRQFGGRLPADIQIPLVVPVKTYNMHTLEETIVLYSPIYVALHSSGSDKNSDLRSSRRSAFNVPDSVELSVATANGGHYFGALLERFRDGAHSDILYLDDDKQDMGHRDELSAQGKKLVVAVLRKQALESEAFFKIAVRGCLPAKFESKNLLEMEESVANFESKNLLEEWAPKLQTVSSVCHRAANQVYIFLRNCDAAKPLFTKEQFNSRRETVVQLFHDHETEQTRTVTLRAIAILWEVRIIVHTFREPAQYFGTEGQAILTVFLHNGVLYPTSPSLEDVCEPVKTAEGLTLGVLTGRRSSSAHQAAFDTIIPLIYPFVVSIFSVDPDHTQICAIRRADPKLELGKLPIIKSSTYWTARRIMQSLCNQESSLLARSSPKSTAIECSYAMIFHLVQVVERFFPFTHESTHLILGCGRRGALLLHTMVDKDMTVVGLEISKEAVVESHQLVAKLQTTDFDYRPKIHTEEANVESLTSIDGFTSVSRFAGGKGAGSKDHTSRNATDVLVLRSPTVKVYWNNHLHDMNDLELSDEIKAEWRVLVLPSTRQESNQYSTFMYFRVKPATIIADISPRIAKLITAAQRSTPQRLLQYGTRTPRQSQRVVDQKDNDSGKKRVRSAVGSQNTPEASDTPKKATKTPTPRSAKSRAVTPVFAPVEPSTEPSTVGDTPSGRKRKGRAQVGDADGMVNQESVTAAMLKETTRNLSADFKKILTEVQKVNETLNEHLLETNKKVPSKTEVTALSKQLSSAGFRESAEILKQIPTLAAKLDAAQEAIDRLPNNLTSQMRASEKTQAEKSGTKAPHVESDQVLAQLQATLSQIPTTISAALAPSGSQTGMHDVQKVLRDLTAGFATKERDLLWLETIRQQGLRDQETVLKAEAKRKKHEKDKKKKKKKADRKEKKKAKKEKKEKKRQKIAADEKEQILAVKAMTEEGKTQLLSLLQETGALRMHRSPSKADGDKEKKKEKKKKKERESSSECSESSESSERSGSRDRSRGRSKSRARDRGKRRRKSRSRERSRRSQHRGKNREELASVLDAGEEGVGMWLIKNNLGDFRDTFKKSNVCGADLKNLSTTTLAKFGMLEHQLARFLNLIAKL